MDRDVHALLARRGALVALVALALAFAGCGSPREPLPAACLARPPAMLAALERAPRPVVLEGGTSLARCTRLARTDGDLQTLGYSLMRVADTLRRQAASDPGAALRLGYLAGAVRAGAAAGSGLAAQLARRVEQVAVLEQDAGVAARAALRRGLSAGQRNG